MFWMAKVPDNNSEVYDVGDRRLTIRWEKCEIIGVIRSKKMKSPNRPAEAPQFLFSMEPYFIIG